MLAQVLGWTCGTASSSRCCRAFLCTTAQSQRGTYALFLSPVCSPCVVNALTRQTKRFYNHPRPVSVIQCLNAGQQIKTWRGPYQGVGVVPAEQWTPYNPPSFNTPPFPGYVSGTCAHS